MNRTTSFLAGLAAGAGVVALARGGRGDDLTDAIALVTGGSRGLGFLIARELLREGCYVVICARDARELRSAHERLAGHGATTAHLRAIECDVTDRAAVADMVRRIAGELGAIDVVVNNAGVISVGPERSMTDADYAEALDVNFWGTVNVTRAVLPSMRARRSGRIANVTSIGGTVPLPHMVPYSASKFAAFGFSQALGVEVAREGIHVTTLVPGLMRTGSPVNSWFKGDARAEFAWFGAGSSTPLTAMSADRAARRIVLAIRRRERVVVLTWQARLMRAAHAVAPGLTAGLASMVNRALPKDGSTLRWLGMEVDDGFQRNPLYAGVYRPARRNNEYARAYPSAPGETIT